MKRSHALPYHSRDPGSIKSFLLALKALVMFLSFERYLSANLESHLLPVKQTCSYPSSSGGW